MKNSILNLANVSELSSETKKNISGGAPKVKIVAAYCCVDGNGNLYNASSLNAPTKWSGNGACPVGYSYAEGLACDPLSNDGLL